MWCFWRVGRYASSSHAPQYGTRPYTRTTPHARVPCPAAQANYGGVRGVLPKPTESSQDEDGRQQSSEDGAPPPQEDPGLADTEDDDGVRTGRHNVCVLFCVKQIMCVFPSSYLLVLRRAIPYLFCCVQRPVYPPHTCDAPPRITVLQLAVEMSWNMSHYLPEEGACQANFATIVASYISAVYQQIAAEVDALTPGR